MQSEHGVGPVMRQVMRGACEGFIDGRLHSKRKYVGDVCKPMYRYESCVSWDGYQYHTGNILTSLDKIITCIDNKRDIAALVTFSCSWHDYHADTK